MSSGSDAIVNAGVGILHSAFATAIKNTFDDAGKFLDSLIAANLKRDPNDPDVKARKAAFEALKTRIQTDAAFFGSFKKKVGDPIIAAKGKLADVGAALANGGVLGGAKAAVILADMVKLVGQALDGVADAAQPVTAADPAARAKEQQIHDAIAGFDDPITGPLRAIGSAAGAAGGAAVGAFNSVCQEAFGISDAGDKLARAADLKWDRPSIACRPGLANARLLLRPRRNQAPHRPRRAGARSERLLC